MKKIKSLNKWAKFMFGGKKQKKISKVAPYYQIFQCWGGGGSTYFICPKNYQP